MATMKVTFELSDDDLKHFRRLMKEIRERYQGSSEAEIVAAASRVLQEIGSVATPDFITVRMQKLRNLIEMLSDEEWALAGRDRERVVRGLAYFAEPEDMIPDRVPVLGYLDDAIMIELVVNELVHEIDAYADFCEFRATREERFGKDEDPATREEWVVARRQALHQRIRRRRGRRRGDRNTVAGGPRISLW